MPDEFNQRTNQNSISSYEERIVDIMPNVQTLLIVRGYIKVYLLVLEAGPLNCVLRGSSAMFPS